MEEIRTPRIEQELVPSGDLSRYRASLADIRRARERGSIRLPEWKALRRFLSRTIGLATAGPVNAYWLAHSQDRERLTQVGVVQRLQDVPRLLTYLRRHTNVPEVQDLVEVLTEAGLLVTALESLRFARPGLTAKATPKVTKVGTCPVCMKMHKLRGKAQMVHHGFSITDELGRYLGFRAGRCPGSGCLAYELSTEGNVAFCGSLVAQQKALEERLRALRSGQVTELHHRDWVKVNGAYVTTVETITDADFRFPTALDYEQRHVEGVLNELQGELEHQRFRIRTWTPQPLPEKV